MSGRIDGRRHWGEALQQQDATRQELVLVCAAAGFGKSTLLADWVRADHRAVAFRLDHLPWSLTPGALHPQ
jgi:hypothetical protein